VDCLVCKHLERIFKGLNNECIMARSSLYCSVSSGLAAYDNVEMERARHDLETHREVCGFAVTEPAGLRHAPFLSS